MYGSIQHRKELNMASKWKYQKGKYKQITLKFAIDDDDEMLLYHFIRSYDNQSAKIKHLIKMEMWKQAYEGE